MTISCADIPRLPGLESIRLRAGFEGAGRLVRWPYVAENDSIAQWVRGGELVFVTGINHHRSATNLCRMVREAHERDVAGIVILTGPEFIREIPKMVLSEANTLGLPVFEQPYDLKMVIVTEVISNAIVQESLLGQSVKLFLTRLINGFAEAPELIHLRAGELGLSDRRPYVCLAARLSRLETSLKNETEEAQWHQVHLKTQVEQTLASLLKRRNIDWPVLAHDQDLLVIWPVDDHGDELESQLTQALKALKRELPEVDLYLGVSDSQPGLANLSTAVDQARQAVQFAAQLRHQRIIFNSQLGIARLFAAIPERRLLGEFCQQQLGPLCFARDPQSVELKNTLSQYFSAFGNQQQAARLLGIHRNTLCHRLKRLEQLLTADLDDPFRRLNLQNALLIEQLLFQHHTLENAQGTEPD